MLSGTVHTTERLFMEKDLELMSVGYTVHDIHSQQVVVDCQHGFFEHRCNLELGRSNFVVSCLDRASQSSQFVLAFTNCGQDACGDLAKVVVFQLLVTGRETTNKSTAGDLQVRAESVEASIDKEEFLLGTKGGEHMLGSRMIYD